MKTKILHFVKWRKGLYEVEMEFETLAAAQELVQHLHAQGQQVSMRAEERRCL